MEKELKKLLNNYVNVIHGKAFPINPTTHQLHLLLDYIANLEQQLCYFKKENQELKLELSGYRQAILEDKDMLGLKEESKISFRKCLNILDKKETQQKEFIKYLEDYLKLFDKMDIDAKISYDMLEEILQKYKEIIGVLK